MSYEEEDTCVVRKHVCVCVSVCVCVCVCTQVSEVVDVQVPHGAAAFLDRHARVR